MESHRLKGAGVQPAGVLFQKAAPGFAYRTTVLQSAGANVVILITKNVRIIIVRTFRILFLAKRLSPLAEKSHDVFCLRFHGALCRTGCLCRVRTGR